MAEFEEEFIDTAKDRNSYLPTHLQKETFFGMVGSTPGRVEISGKTDVRFATRYKGSDEVLDGGEAIDQAVEGIVGGLGGGEETSAACGVDFTSDFDDDNGNMSQENELTNRIQITVVIIWLEWQTRQEKLPVDTSSYD